MVMFSLGLLAGACLGLTVGLTLYALFVATHGDGNAPPPPGQAGHGRHRPPGGESTHSKQGGFQPSGRTPRRDIPPPPPTAGPGGPGGRLPPRGQQSGTTRPVASWPPPE